MKKKRTRKHIIESLGVNWVERQVFLAGYTAEKVTHDYGYDLSIKTYNDEGEIEVGLIWVQVKSTDNIKFSEKKKSVLFNLSKKDLTLWLREANLVFLAVYDAITETSYYLNVQQYFIDNKISLSKINKYIQVFIPKRNVLTPKMVKQIRIIKNKQIEYYVSQYKNNIK